MISHQQYTTAPWPQWRRIIFRFLVIYFSLQVISWPYFKHKKAFYYLEASQNFVLNKLVNCFNNWFVHIPGPLKDYNNNHDSPFRVVLLLAYIILAFIATATWTLAARSKKAYYAEDYYFKTLLRYFIAYISFIYGTVKIFMLQMPFPLLSEMATPLGDHTPMAFSWLYIGYSPLYEFFLGTAEIITGLLLLSRRTMLLGLFMALSVYINVLMINICYDIPVKIFSFHLVIMCLYLLLDDGKRLINFFFLNKVAEPSTAYVVIPSRRSRYLLKNVLKIVFFLICGYTFVQRYQRLNAIKTYPNPIPYGLYEVSEFVKNGDTLPVLANDSIIWKDIIFEKGLNYATINTADPLFLRDKSRGGFFYRADTLNNRLECYRAKNMKGPELFELHYKVLDSNSVMLHTKLASDSISVKIIRSKKKFNLEGRPFHWLETGGR